MALVFSQPSDSRSSRPTVRVKDDVLSLIVPRRNLRAPVLPEPDTADTLTTKTLPKHCRRFQALSVTGAGKPVCRFCRCGPELHYNATVTAFPKLRISTTPGVLADPIPSPTSTVTASTPEVRATPSLTMGNQFPAKPKQLRGAPPLVRMREHSFLYDW